MNEQGGIGESDNKGLGSPSIASLSFAMGGLSFAEASGPAPEPAILSAEIPSLFRLAETLVAEELAAAKGDFCVTNSFQAEDMIVLHMVIRMKPDVPVVFLDTGYHFAEVYDYRDRMAKAWGMNLINLLPEFTVPEHEARFGILNQTEPGRCCGMRKVKPLFAELDRYGLWFTGLRREQAKSRAALQQVEDFALPTGRTISKISPLTEWTARDVWQYAARHEIPLLSLYEKGYSSIGCEPCTSLPVDPNDPRSGRWGGQKQECGIHIQASSPNL